MYDAQALPILESEARATGHYLARVLTAAQQHQAKFLDTYDLLATAPADAQRYQAVERLMAGMQAYVEATTAYLTQLEENLHEAEVTAHREAQRATFFLQQFKLTHADLLTEQALQVQQSEVFTAILTRA